MRALKKDATSCCVSLFVVCSLATALNKCTYCAGVFAIRSTCRSAQAQAQREFFHVGGSLLDIGTGNLTVNELYVESLTPSSGDTEAKPLLFLNGGATLLMVELVLQATSLWGIWCT
jgi:hypothetical protein